MLKQQSRLGNWDFIRPGRTLVKGRYFSLLSDCLLYCSYQGSWARDSTSLKVSHIKVCLVTIL